MESEGFFVFMRKVSPLYQVPSRKTLTELIEERYDVLSPKIKDELSNVSATCLTSDVWTEPHNTKSFIDLTAHYLFKDKIKNVTIGLEELSQSHTAEYLTSKLLEFTRRWNIKHDAIVAVVTDSAANMKQAAMDAFGEEKWLPCFAHLLNLVPSKIINDDPIVTPLITKIKKIVTYFKKSTNVADKLRELSELKLIQSCETRWNSCFEMLRRFVELADKISVILLQVDGPEMLTSSELRIIKEFITLLQPFHEATQIVSQEKYFSGSKCIPVVKTIKSQLSTIPVSTDTGIHLQKRLQEACQKRFNQIEEMSLLAAATILDPRFKKAPF